MGFLQSTGAVDMGEKKRPVQPHKELAQDVPVLVMCPCWRGATSPASQIIDFFLKKKKTRVCLGQSGEWAGDEDWICNRTRCQALEDQTRFVTFAVKSVNLSTIHRTRTGKTRRNKAVDKRHQEYWDPQAKPSMFVKRDRQRSYVATVRWRRSGSTASTLWDKNTEGELTRFKKLYTCVDMESTATRIPVTIEPRRLVNGPSWNLNCFNPWSFAVATKCLGPLRN